MSEDTKKLKPIVIIPIREKAEPEAWTITYMHESVPVTIQLNTVKGRNTQAIDWKGHVEMKYGKFVSATIGD